MLFAIDVPDRSPEARARVSDYNALTSADLSRGAPRKATGPDKTSIAAATLSKFGPEPKAAIILTAANELFSSIEPDLAAVLRITCLASDAQPLADVMRIAAWATLLLDVYAAQPTLLAAAVKARSIQQGALEPWDPWVDDAVAEHSSPIEFGAAKRQSAWHTDRGTETRELRIIDELMVKEVKPVFVEHTNHDISNSLLVEDTIHRFVVHLLRSGFDSGLVRINAAPDGTIREDVIATRTGLLSAFTETNLRLYEMISPVGVSGRERFDASLPSHQERMMPRVPSEFELVGLSQTAQIEAIEVLLSLFRLIRNMRDDFPEAMRWEVRRRIGELDRVVAQIYGPDSYLSLRVHTAYLAATQADLRVRPPRDFDTHRTSLEVGAELIEGYRRLKRDYRAEVNPGEWLSFIDYMSPSVSTHARDLGDTGDDAGRDALHEELIQDWHDAFLEVGIDISRVPKTELERHGAGLVTLLHNWSALVMRVPSNTARYQRAFDIAADVVLLLRKQMAERRRNDKTYKFTLQVLSRGLCQGLSALPHEQKSAALTRLTFLGNELVHTSRARQLIQAGPAELEWNSSDTNTTIALIRIGVIQHEENATAGSQVTTEMVEALLKHTIDFLAEAAGGDKPKANDRTTQLTELARRWDKVREQAR